MSANRSKSLTKLKPAGKGNEMKQNTISKFFAKKEITEGAADFGRLNEKTLCKKRSRSPGRNLMKSKKQKQCTVDLTEDSTQTQGKKQFTVDLTEDSTQIEGKKQCIVDLTEDSAQTQASFPKQGTSLNQEFFVQSAHSSNVELIDSLQSVTSQSCSKKISDSTMSKLNKFNTDSERDSRDIWKSRHFGESFCASTDDQNYKGTETEEDTTISTSPNVQGNAIYKKVKQLSDETENITQPNKWTKCKYTPLEQQYLDIKEKYPDALLFVECGYKYRFFGEDAENAAEVLNIFCHMDHNFMTASIPVHRLFVHIRRLVAAGYKVGVVKQTETAAIKASGDNRSAPFTRELTAMYTKSTLIGQDVDPILASNVIEGEVTSDSSNDYLLCVYDAPLDKNSKQQTIAILAVQPSTGDIIYDSFEDSDIRNQLETRILHIQPVEVLTCKTLSAQTMKLLNDVISLSSTDSDKIRLECMDDAVFDFREAFQNVTEFYKSVTTDPSDVQFVINLPQPVISCLAAILRYLTDFGLQKVLNDTRNFSKFSIKSKHLHLPGNTLRNLEIFNNQNDGKETGSFFWMFNQTFSKFGCRKLKMWLTYPLLDVSEIQRRQDAVDEILHGYHSGMLWRLRLSLGKSPDLEKGLNSIFHEKCSVQEFYGVCKVLSSFVTDMKHMRNMMGDRCNSAMILNIFEEVPQFLSDIHQFVEALEESSVKTNDKTSIFKKEEEFPDIVNRKRDIANVKSTIMNHRREIRLTLHQPALDYTTVMGTEYLIEVKNSLLHVVPKDWFKVSSTKTVSRFHSPFIREKYKELNQLKEQLVIDSNKAWLQFLGKFNEGYRRYRKAVGLLATLDCLYSMAWIAKHHGFCRPEIHPNETCIHIEQGRHPTIQQLLGTHGQYVANDTNISVDGNRVMIITGPNMGGKSSYIKQVAIISILAQIGSFVPADSAKLGILDAVLTRMGAADEIFCGRSTFKVELQQASEIISQATSKSLVILDELGRGTSTHDGVAIAYATLEHFIKHVKCLTLFVTHYPILAEFEEMFPGVVLNTHMSFLVHDDTDSETQHITFLYQLVEGTAARSYGLNVARLAGIQDDVIHTASVLSTKLEEREHCRRHGIDIFKQLLTAEEDQDIIKTAKDYQFKDKFEND